MIMNSQGDSPHPFLLFRKHEIPALRARSSQSPWREMAAQARIEAVGDETHPAICFDPAAPVRTRAGLLSRIVSTTALTYLLAPESEQPSLRARIVAHFSYWDRQTPGNLTADLPEDRPSPDWNHSTPIGAAFFNSVLALDLIHNDLPASQVTALESILEAGPGKHFRTHLAVWKSHGYAARGIWALYQNDHATFSAATAGYRHEILDTITQDGVYVEGPGYATARWWWADREHKHYFGDVLAHQGVWPDWPATPQVRELMEWLTGYARTPGGQLWVFGDTAGDDEFPQYTRYLPGLERALQASPTAASFAARQIGSEPLAARLCTYVGLKGSIPPPATPPSRIFADGGAFFRAPDPSDQALAAVLWNPRSARGHNHKEVNAVAVAAFGHRLLRGAGYEGWAKASHGFTWNYVNHRAVSGNVVLIDYQIGDPRDPSPDHDHQHKFGAGVRGLTCGFVDYALGDSAAALPNGHHLRHLLRISPEGDEPGYCVCLDEIHAVPGARTAQVVWHASGTGPTESEAGAELCWEQPGRGVGLAIGLITPSEKREYPEGLHANWHGSDVHRYLVAHYPLVKASARVLTLLRPFTADRPVRRWTRHEIDGASGAEWTAPSGVKELVLSLSPERIVPIAEGVRAQGIGGWIRSSTTPAITGCLISGLCLEAPGFRWQSETPATLAWKGHELNILTPGSRCELRGPLVRSLRLNGRSVAQPAGDFVTLDLSAGVHCLTWD